MKAALQIKPKTSSSAPPTFTPVRSGLLQRKCACGGTPGPSGECDACCKKKLQRRSENLDRSSISHPPSWVSEVPPIVHEVLRSPGQPLDEKTRAFMEPRFSHDFSNVRVHTDRQAAESARAVNALAYTVGSQIAFGRGRYAPESGTGRQLLAHELAHVVQQRAGVHLKDGIGQEGDAYEMQADAVAVSTQLEPMPFGSGSGNDGCVDGALMEATELVPFGQRAIQFQTKTPGKPENETDLDNYAGKELGPVKDLIMAITKATPPTGSPLVFGEGAHFVLHDTASVRKSADELQGAKDKERGPLGVTGAAAYIPFTNGGPVIVRPNLFTSQRVTASGYEKRLDIKDLASREIVFQQIWKATKATVRAQALDDALANYRLDPREKETEAEESSRAIAARKLTQKEIITQQTAAAQQLVASLPEKREKDDKPKILTTAAWTIAKICEKFTNAPAEMQQGMATNLAELREGCASLTDSDYFCLQEQRLGSSVNVEISREAGGHCDPKGPSFPPYPEHQYVNVVSVYLQAALHANQFPEITTHYWIDKKAGDHCDPRCFHLNHLYNLIAAQLGHPKGSTYGIKPNPGTTHAKHNLWWSDKVCGGGYPSE
jgi:hypothetical protein